MNPTSVSRHNGGRSAAGLGCRSDNDGSRGMTELRMGKELVGFLQKQGGAAPSSSIISHFQDRLVRVDGTASMNEVSWRMKQALAERIDNCTVKSNSVQ